MSSSYSTLSELSAWKLKYTIYSDHTLHRRYKWHNMNSIIEAFSARKNRIFQSSITKIDCLYIMCIKYATLQLESHLKFVFSPF